MGMYQLPNEVIQQALPIGTSQNTVRSGREGQTPHRRVDEAATPLGLGTVTTDHQKTNGGSLTTLASGP